MSTNGCCEMNLRRMRTVLQHVIECKSGCACAQKSQKYGLQNQYSFSEMRLIILKCKANNGNLSGLLGFVYTSFTYNSQEKRMIGCLYRHRQRWWGYSRLLPFLTPVTGVNGSRLHKALGKQIGKKISKSKQIGKKLSKCKELGKGIINKP